MTIYDIAREAGVSASTVSRVINKKKGVNSEKRILIEGLLKKYNFEPDASARGLVQQSTKIIGILMSDIRTSHHAEGAYYIEQELKKHGYTCIIINSGFSDETREESIRTLFSRRVEAVMLIGSTFQTENMKKAIQKYFNNLPVIIENGFIDLPNVYCVLADEQNGIADCVRLLHAKGKKHTAFINLADTTPSSSLKALGYETAAKTLYPNQIPCISRINAGSDEWQSGYDATLKLMEKYPETDGIIYATDLLANAGVLALQRAGYRIPEHISVIGVDNSIYARISSPPLTSLDNQLELLSITCSHVLVKVLNGEKTANKIMLLSNIVERKST